MTVWLLDPPDRATPPGLRAQLATALHDTAFVDAAPDDTAVSIAAVSIAAVSTKGDRAASGGRHRGAVGCARIARTSCASCAPRRPGEPAAHTAAPAAALGPRPDGAGVETATATESPTRRCLLVDADRDPVELPILDPEASGLRPRDVLAVLTRSHHDGARLHDPRPALVAAAVAAGWEHLQHIVTITRDARAESGWRLGPDLTLLRRPTPPDNTDNGEGGEGGVGGVGGGQVTRR